MDRERSPNMGRSLIHDPEQDMTHYVDSPEQRVWMRKYLPPPPPKWMAFDLIQRPAFECECGHKSSSPIERCFEVRKGEFEHVVRWL